MAAAAPKRPIRKSNLAGICEAVIISEADKKRAVLDAAIERARNSGRYDKKMGQSKKVSDSFLDDLEKAQTRQCCKEMKEATKSFSRDQRTFVYNSILLWEFDLTPNQSETATEYKESARGDLTMEQAMAPVSVRPKLFTCLGRVESEIGEEYAKKHPDLMK